MRTRTVTAELLRAGRRHNQLLSPLTGYLGVCGDEAAGLVHVPYEHAELVELLNELRYKVTDEEDPGRRRSVLHRLGARIASVLNQIPGLGGALKPELAQSETLTHLRLVLSASELAMLPFEASKVPAGAGLSENWLSLRTTAPVCLTRKIRSVQSERVKWFTEPRILFVTGPDVPVEEHKRALLEAIRPWIGPGRGAGYWLEHLDNPSRNEIAEAYRKTPYTHVHILAHGAVDENRTGQPFGVLLADSVLSGDELSSALIHVSSDEVRIPTVVTLATCDSAQQKQVYTPDASVAHELHSKGIPLVVASQFPLSVEGSIPFVRTFYTDQMLGEHPLLTLYRVRLGLHGRDDVHDWASLVVYEALPADLEAQLERLHYLQAVRAHDAALGWVEQHVADGIVPTDAELERVAAASRRYPNKGPYAADSIGRRAAGHKRLAEVHYVVSRRFKAVDKKLQLRRCHSDLESAFAEYRRALESFLVNEDGTMHREASLHWLGVQTLSMATVLGVQAPEDLRFAARLAANVDLEHQIGRRNRAWAHGSLGELALLKLADPQVRPAERKRLASKAEKHAHEILRSCGRRSPQAQSTARQFRRYLSWWGKPAFAKALEELDVSSKTHWRRRHGLIDTAKRIVSLLAGTEVLESANSALGPKVESQPGPALPAPARPSRIKHSAKARASASLAVEPGSDENTDSDFVIEMLPARNGDCLWIEYGPRDKRSRLIVDCGSLSAAEALQARLDRVQAEDGGNSLFDLFVLTHIDSDHISGVTRFFESAEIEFDDIWFNGWPQLPKEKLDPKFLGVKQGEEYSVLLAEQNRPWNRRAPKQENGAPGAMSIPDSGNLPSFTLPGGMTLTLLSPGRSELEDLARFWAKGRRELEPSQRFLGGKRPPAIQDASRLDLEELAGNRTAPDPSVANGSSIAILAEYGTKAALLSGDAHAEVVAGSIRRLLEERGAVGGRLAIDALKLSHHGSANALSKELLELLDCPRYLVSTNGSHFYHPHREAIARVIVHGGEAPTIFFNYSLEDNRYIVPWADPELQERYSFRTAFPNTDDPGMRIPL